MLLLGSEQLHRLGECQANRDLASNAEHKRNGPFSLSTPLPPPRPNLNPMKRQRASPRAALPTARAIDVLVNSLIALDTELSSIDMDHAVRSQYSFVVKKFMSTAEGKVIDKLVERVAEQNQRGLKARHVLNEIIHKIPPLNAKQPPKHHVENDTTEKETEGINQDKLVTEPRGNSVSKNSTSTETKVKEEETKSSTATSTQKNPDDPMTIDPDWVDPRQDTSTMSALLLEYEHAHGMIDDFTTVPTEEDILNGNSLLKPETVQASTPTKKKKGQQGNSDNAEADTSAWNENTMHSNEYDDLIHLDDRLKDGVYDDNIENYLISHMTIEERQLRPVTIALSCAVLFKTWSKVPRFFHLNKTCNALMRVIYTHPNQHLSIYTTEDPEEYATAITACNEADMKDKDGTWNVHGKTAHLEQQSPDHPYFERTNGVDSTATATATATVVPSLTDLLSNVPYASIVRDLEPQVEALVKQRILMSAAQVNALARRESRKRAILRTAAKWQSNMLHTNFVQWHNMTRTLKQQRVQLVGHFLKMHTPKLKDVFDAWHIISINNTLAKCEEARDRTKNMMNTLREQLEESRTTGR